MGRKYLRFVFYFGLMSNISIGGVLFIRTGFRWGSGRCWCLWKVRSKVWFLLSLGEYRCATFGGKFWGIIIVYVVILGC